MAETSLRIHTNPAIIVDGENDWNTIESKSQNYPDTRNNQNAANRQKPSPQKLHSAAHETETGPTVVEVTERPNSGPSTWLEDQEEAQRNDEVRAMSTVKEQIIKELTTLKEAVIKWFLFDAYIHSLITHGLHIYKCELQLQISYLTCSCLCFAICGLIYYGECAVIEAGKIWAGLCCFLKLFWYHL